MSELYNATEIAKMSRMILKTVDMMEKDLEEVIKNLGIYRTCLQDDITNDTNRLVKNIRDKIDSIRVEFGERAKDAEDAAMLIDRLENGGLGGI